MNPAPQGRSSPGVSASCGWDLTQVPTTAVTQRRLLDAQRTVNRLLAGEGLPVAGQPTPPLEIFGHLRSLVSLALHVAQPTDLGALQAEVQAAFEEHADPGTRRIWPGAWHPWRPAPGR
ncbi:hypothetical protein [Deinococcus carri]